MEEADETVFWLELLIETGIVSQARMDGLLIEANELLAIFATLQRTAKTPMVRKKNESMTQFPLPNDSMKNEAMTQFLHPFLYNPASFAH